MFNRDEYCQRYFMRKEAGLASALYNLGGSALSTAGKFITKHFGDGKYLSQAGNKLSNWGANFTRKGDMLNFYDKNWAVGVTPAATMARPASAATNMRALPAGSSTAATTSNLPAVISH